MAPVPPLPQVPADDLTRAMLDAAFAETERVMRERGLDEAGITSEFLMRAVDRLWGDEDREGLRAKVCAVVSADVDALFDGIGDAVRRAA